MLPSPRETGRGWRANASRVRGMRGPDTSAVKQQRRLRRNSTDAEMRIWLALRDRRLGGFKFVRQETIGPYVADFACRGRKLIVELDGGQHSENNRDRARDAFLAAEGYKVLRFWNNDVMTNRDGVLEVILAELESHR
jgi:very-short-patch-repair endonuclease